MDVVEDGDEDAAVARLVEASAEAGADAASTRTTRLVELGERVKVVERALEIAC